nr:serine hydrolase domain-containing protein [uncultured Undibacterium sp.]
MRNLYRNGITSVALVCLSIGAFASDVMKQNHTQVAPSLYLNQQTLQMNKGSRLVVPGGWQVQNDGDLLVLDMPEQGGKIALVEVLADDAAQAIAAAWTRFKPDFAQALPKLTALPDENGWSARALANYHTSASSEDFLQVQARRAGVFWNVMLSVGQTASFSKRAVDVSIIKSSLLAPGFEGESLQGRVPHRLDAGRIAQMKNFLADGMVRLHIPGLAFALLDRGKVVYEGGMGVRQLGKPELVDTHTVFMNGSTTKPITTMLVASLVDQGKLSWDQSVTEVYPPFKLLDAATTKRVQIRHLACACTGVPNHQIQLFFGFRQVNPETLIARLANEPLTSPFGEVYQYSNQMVAAAGYVAGHAAYPTLALGPAYDKAMQKLIFDPLGMADTTFDMKRAQRANHAVPHGISADGKTAVTAMDLNYSLEVFRPAGGAWTSIHDMARFMQLEASAGKLPNGKQLIRAEQVLARRIPQVAAALHSYYGMGVGINQKLGITSINHTGTTFGFNSISFLVPESGIGMVAMSNTDQGVGLLNLARRRLLELVYDAKPEAESTLVKLVTQNENDGQEQRALVASADNSLEGQLGTHYAHPIFGKLTVSKIGNSLVFDFGEWKTRVVGRKDESGVVLFSSIDPSIGFVDFRVHNTEGTRAIVIEMGLERYQFDEVTNGAAK